MVATLTAGLQKDQSVAVSALTRPIGRQTIVNALSNCLLTAVGVGILGLGKAMAEAGWVTGFTLLVASGLISLTTSELLCYCIQEVPKSVPLFSLEDLCGYYMGTFGRLAAAFSVHSALVGSGGILLLLLADNSTLLFGVMSSKEWTLTWAGIVAPFVVFLKDMKNISNVTGTIGTLSVIVILVSVVIAGIMETADHAGDFPHNAAPRGLAGIGTAFAMLIFSYAVNCTLTTILLDMRNLQEGPKMVRMSFLCQFFLYFTVALVSFLGFGQTLSELDTISEAIARSDLDMVRAGGKVVTSSVIIVCATHLIVMMNPSCRAVERAVGLPELLSTWKETLISYFLRFSLLGSALLMALYIPKFTALVDLLGSISFSMLQLVLPPLCFFSLRRIQGKQVGLSVKEGAMNRWGFVFQVYLVLVLLVAFLGMVLGVLSAVTELRK